MKTAYQANSAIDAHLVLHLLEHSGIDAKIFGEHLQGGIGEIQTMGLVRVMTDDTSYERARKIIEDWESQEVPTDEEMEKYDTD
ncbi:MAG: DUF2007 domain-containing protein [Proteobacteria bacterium]|nr:DUF2007 domain-containing protein [Pseudomonadota bacterium]